MIDKLKSMFSKETPKANTPSTSGFSKVIQYSKVDPPSFKEMKNKGWVSYGKDNKYPEFLLDMLEGSSIHNGIVQGKSYLISGDDFLYNGQTLDSLKETDLTSWLKLDQLIRNGYNESWYDLKKQFALDYTIAGAFALKIKWAIDFSKIVEVEYVPWQWLRSGIRNEDGKVTTYYISDDWKKTSVDAVEYQAFNVEAHLPDGILPEQYESVDDYPYDHHQILYVKNWHPGYEYYGRPLYQGAVNDIKSTIVLSQFYLSSIENGFTPSMVVTFNEEPGSEEEGYRVTESLERQFTQKGAGRKLAVFFAKDKDKAPTFQPLDVKNLDAQMLQIQNQIYTSIITAHAVTNPELVGINIPGKLGTSDIKSSYEIFKSTVIDKDKAVIERVLQMIASINGINGKLTISNKTLFTQ